VYARFWREKNLYMAVILFTFAQNSGMLIISVFMQNKGRRHAGKKAPPKADFSPAFWKMSERIESFTQHTVFFV